MAADIVMSPGRGDYSLFQPQAKDTLPLQVIDWRFMSSDWLRVLAETKCSMWIIILAHSSVCATVPDTVASESRREEVERSAGSSSCLDGPLFFLLVGVASNPRRHQAIVPSQASCG